MLYTTQMKINVLDGMARLFRINLTFCRVLMASTSYFEITSIFDTHIWRRMADDAFEAIASSTGTAAEYVNCQIATRQNRLLTFRCTSFKTIAHKASV